MASLAVTNLSKKFGAAKIIDDLSFDVRDGEFCVLLGPSGCGKTTLLRIIAGLEDSSGGSIAIGDRRVDRLAPRERDVAFVFQTYALYPHLNVAENLAFSLELRGAPREEIRRRVDETAKILGLDGLLSRKPRELSGGQRQRVAVGRAIIRQPKVFLFDEPLSNLDAALRAEMRLELARLHRRLGATILYVTHDQAEAMTLADKIIVLDQGRIQQIGAPAEIYHAPANVFVAGFVGSPRMNFIDGRIDQRGIFTAEGCRFDVGGLTDVQAGESVTLGVRPEDLELAGEREAAIEGKVDIIEDLGSDKFVHLKSAGREWVARVVPETRVNPGDFIRLTASRGRIHLFSGGRRATNPSA
ncbi:MAG TPA: sn-glycerol-3-phosphate ABC transporter ATP-binding protein UgpC [Verrucomicrobiae bacterium]|nr:sn-glycerol-3-phosphate ABC transporter ATP-binding protein UgpC [Verrucomicrobiae bacterium]